MSTTTIRPNNAGIFPMAPRNEVFDLALGNGTQFQVLVNVGPRGLFLAVENRGAYTFVTRATPGYVAEKLDLKRYMGDAANLADFINDQNGPGETDRQGDYFSGLTISR